MDKGITYIFLWTLLWLHKKLFLRTPLYSYFLKYEHTYFLFMYSSSNLNRVKWSWNTSLVFLGSWNIVRKTSVKTLIQLKQKLWRLQIFLALLLISYDSYFFKERKSLKNDVFRFDVFLNVFRFLEKWPWIIISVYFLFRDTRINMAHVSNRLKFDTFFTFILSFENGFSDNWTSLTSKNRHLFDKNAHRIQRPTLVSRAQEFQYDSRNKLCQHEIETKFTSLINCSVCCEIYINNTKGF